MAVGNVIFLFILVIATGFFALNVQRLVSYLELGYAEGRTDHPFTRLRNVFEIGIAQKKIFRDPIAGPMHALIFWGFMVLTAGTVEIIIAGVYPGFSYVLLLPPAIYSAYSASQDVFAVLVLASVSFALFRRTFLHPRRLEGDNLEHTDALIILSMIAGLMLTLLLSNGFLLAANPLAFGADKIISRPIGVALSHVMSPQAAFARFEIFWWAHALLILTFLNYLPYSKHLHVITSLINVYFSNTSGPGAKGAMRYMDLEADVESFGASDVEQLSWKNLLDGYSCTECGRCTAACPANITGKPLSPRKIIVNTRQRLMEKAPLVTGDRMDFMKSALLHGHEEDGGTVTAVDIMEHRLLDGFITEEELWACTSCRACVTECPVSIDQLDVINQMRRNLVLTESRFPEELQPVFESLERNASPWAFNAGDRADWTEGMHIPTMAEMTERGERPDILFWVGCMGSFDDRAKKITVAFARIMQACHINFAILGQEESCHGDPARRMGNEYLYQMLAKNTIETLDRYNVTTIVTHCPHCFH
ncbi:MAG: protein of unknown function cysteine-rich region domain protein, partial [Gemmatimonadetes bacterium]|nr:protein of unknown function cysteine-rich region domain protein [Gemmatimonadota bacterium]